MADDKGAAGIFESRLPYSESHGNSDGGDAGAQNGPFCSACGAGLLFSARARDNGLCGPCTRGSARPPRLTDVEAQHLATRVITAPSGEVPREIGRLADKVLELLARVPPAALAPQSYPIPAQEEMARLHEEGREARRAYLERTSDMERLTPEDLLVVLK